jgi:hypothetical protein
MERYLQNGGTTECSKSFYTVENKTFAYIYINLQKVLEIMSPNLWALLNPSKFTLWYGRNCVGYRCFQPVYSFRVLFVDHTFQLSQIRATNPDNE